MSELSPQTRFAYVGVGRRAIATMIDGTIWFWGFGYLVGLLTGDAGFNPTGGLPAPAGFESMLWANLYEGPDGSIVTVGFGDIWWFNLTAGTAMLTWLLLGFAYYVALEASVGSTIGKLLLGIRVIKTDGEPADWKSSFIRNLLRVVDGIAFYLVAALFAWDSPKRQRLGDRVASTIVVRR